MLTVVALIPARSGSKRVQHKNIRRLGSHPLLAYTLAAAQASQVFTSIIVSTDSEAYAEVARHYGAEVPFLRPSEFAGDCSPDIEWVTHALHTLTEMGKHYDCFSILRPTNPFRSAETIQRAWAQFCEENGIDSLRAVEKCKQHPGKMWVVRGNRMVPLLPLTPADRPWHSMQYHALPEVYVQNASLEIAWTRVALEEGTIAGNTVAPFFTQEYEGFDVNEEKDWWYAQYLIECGTAQLCHVPYDPFDTTCLKRNEE